MRDEKLSAAIASLGTGVYWGVSMRSLSGWYQDDGLLPAETDFGIAPAHMNQLAIVVLGLMFIPLFRRIRGSVPLRCVALTGIASNAAMGAIALWAGSTEAALPPGAAVALSVVRGTGMGCCMLLWGLRFASLDKRRAGRTVALVSAIAFLVYYLALLFAPVPSTVFDSACFAVSLVLFLVAGCPVSRVPRDFCRDKGRDIALFYVSRAGIGLCLGLSHVLLRSSTVPTLSRPLIVAGCVVIGVALLWVARVRDVDLRLLPFVPFAGTGLLLLPCSMQSGGPLFAEVATVLIWFCWIVLSSFQLSELKESFGMDEATLCFSEKAVIMGSWFLGSVVASLVSRGLGGETVGRMGGYAAIVLVYGMVAYAASQIWGLVYSRKKRQLIDEFSRPERERREHLFEVVACKYALSGRELEVLRLLAEGHTRKYIQDALNISNGTAKAHVAHVYQKLGVHKKEELLAFLERERGRE